MAHKKRSFDMLLQANPTSRKRKNICRNDEGMAWMAKQIPIPDEHTLMDHCAKYIADSCACPEDIRQQLNDLAKLTISAWVKIKVGLFLRGLLLDCLLEHEKGLATLAANCVSELFQPFLVHVMLQRDSFCWQGKGMAHWMHIRDFITYINRKFSVDHDVHRLGMTMTFSQDNLPASSMDQRIYLYYRFLNGLDCYRTYPLPIIYPIPHVLRLDYSLMLKIEQRADWSFPLGGFAEEKQKKWKSECSKESKELEMRGLVMTPFSEEQQDLKCKPLVAMLAMMKSKSCSDSTCRHIQILAAMARCHYNNSPLLVFYSGLLALTEPFYKLEYSSCGAFNQRRHFFRFDLFVFLSMALSLLYAKLDLPMICLWKAKNSLGTHFLLAEKIRYAVAYQSIMVNYGQWINAKHLFIHWFPLVPSSSKMYQELVLVHAKSIFYQIEDLSVEVWMTRIFHTNCSRRCFEEYIDTSLARIAELITMAKNVAHQCLAIASLPCEFESQLQLIVDICSIYNFTLQQLYYDSNDIYVYTARLTNLWEKMQWECPGQTVGHLRPFAKQIPYATNAGYYWTLNIDETMVEYRLRLAKFSHVTTSRLLADCLFSIGACMIHHSSYPDINLRALNESLQEYERCSNGRHYRIPLLKRLIDVVSDPQHYMLPIGRPGKLKNCEHQGVQVSEKTVIGKSHEYIKQFCSTLDDAMTGFSNVNANNDESFVIYLKQREELMSTWMHVGKQAFQFAADI